MCEWQSQGLCQGLCVCCRFLVGWSRRPSVKWRQLATASQIIKDLLILALRRAPCSAPLWLLNCTFCLSFCWSGFSFYQSYELNSFFFIKMFFLNHRVSSLNQYGPGAQLITQIKLEWHSGEHIYFQQDPTLMKPHLNSLDPHFSFGSVWKYT